MTRRRFGWLLSIVALVAVPALSTMVAGQGSGATRKAEAALQAAMNKETVAGDLPGAMKDYNAIVTQYGQSEPPIAAQALMRVAGAYGKLGRTAESRQVYAQITKDYANIARDGDRDIVAAARTRYAALTQAARQEPGIRPRRVMTMQAGLSALSPDGTLAAGSSPDGLFILNLASGQSTRLGVEGGSPVFSPDARQIAYARADVSSPPASRVTSLHIVVTTPGAQPRTLVAGEAGQGLAPFGWSPDGKKVFARVGPGAAAMSAGTQSVSLVSVSVADGKVTTIKAFEPRQGPIQPRLSPDGRFVAYSFVDGPTPNRRIFTIDINGHNERDVVKLAGMNMNPIWSPDGRHLLFWNNLSGNLLTNSTVWSVAVDDGAVVGSPSTVHSGLVGLETLLGLSPSGALYTFRSIPNTPNVFIADRTAGSSIVEMFPGESASWSYDGKAIAFLREAGGAGYQLIVRHLDNAEERAYAQDNVSNVSPRWFHDGSGFLVSVGGPAHQGTGGAFYFVNAKTGVSRMLLQRNANGRARTGVALSLDDKTLYMSVKNDLQPQSSLRGIVGVDLATGAETAIATFPGEGLPGEVGVALALSPDGSTLAVMAAANEADVKNWHARIFSVAVNGTGFRQLYGPFPVNRTADLLRWTPDGRSLLFAMAKETKVGWRIMKVPATGGEPVFDGLDSTNLTGSLRLPTLGPGGPFNIDLSPDGSRMTVGARTQASSELWALENVMSVLSSSR